LRNLARGCRTNNYLNLLDLVEIVMNLKTAPLEQQLLLTPEQAAAVLTIGRTRVYALIASGALASVKIGRSRRVTRMPCDALVAELQRKHPSAL